MNKRWIPHSILLFTSVLIIFFLATWLLPKVESTLKLTIENQIRKNTPFTILPEHVEISLFPIRMGFKNIKFIPHEEVKKITNPFEIKKVNFKVSFFDLLFGKFKLSQLEISESDIDLFIDLNLNDDSPTPDLFKILNQIPIAELLISKLNLNISFLKQNYSFKIKGLDLSFFNEKNTLFLNFDTSSIQSFNTSRELSIETGVTLKGMLTPKNFVISEFQIKKENSFLIGSGAGGYDNTKWKLNSFKGSLRAELTFKDIDDALGVVQIKNPLIDFHGTNRIDVNLSSEKGDIEAEFSTLTRNFMIEDIKLFSVSTEGKVVKNKIHINALNIDHPGGQALIEDANINLKEKSITLPIVKINKFNLKDFLLESTITDAYVYAKINGLIKCNGNFIENFILNCSGELNGNDFIVKNSKGSRTIIQVKELKLNGEMQVKETEIAYKANLESERSKGTSEGTINYKNGFEISYSTEKVDLDEIKEISELKMSGLAAIKGKTKGNSDAAVFDMSISSTNFKFQNYFLGDIKTYLHYKTGALNFDEINATLGSSRYRGKLVANVNTDTLEATLSFPYLRLQDVQEAIKIPIPLPTELKGSGSAQIRLWGPFEIKKVNFDLTSLFFRGEVLKQSFEELRLPVKARDGVIQISEAKSKIKNSFLIWNGEISPELITSLTFNGDSLYLRDFDFINNNQIPANGFLSLKGKITGPIDKAQVAAEGTIDGFNFNKKIIDRSKFSLIYNPNKFLIEANSKELFNFSLQIPQNKSELFILKGLTQNFDFAPFISFLVAPKPKDDYMMPASTLFQITGPDMSFWNMSGDIKLNDLVIQQSSSNIKLKQPVNINLRNGSIGFQPIELRGNSEFLKISNQATTTKSVDISLLGELDLSYYSIFVPFIENLDGLSTFKLNFKSNPNNTSLLGSALIESGTLKLENFNYPFTNLKGDFLFSQNEVIINSIKSSFADGQLLGNGSVKINGKKDFPINVNATISNMNIEIPDNVKTSGNANLKITGNWFPFLIEGRYQILNGFIDYEISNKQQAKTKDDSLYPESLRESNESPIAFNINIATTKKIDIKNSIIDGYGLANFVLSGPLGALQMSGKASLTQPTKIIFKDTEFTVVDSSFKFENGPIDPELFLRAQARVKTYDIQLLIQGKSSAPIIKFISTPALSENEIISLLALGTTTTGTTSSQLLATSLNATPTSTTNQSATQGLEVGTSLLSNNPLGREFKQRTGFDINFSSNIANDELSGATVVLTKKLSNQVQVTASHRTGKRSESTVRLRRNFDDRFSGAMSIKNQNYQEVQDSSINQGTYWGLDLEYRKEFK